MAQESSPSPQKKNKIIFFFQTFLKNRQFVGSITPSSRFLVNTMLNGIDFDRAKLVIELGPGEGCLTRRLLERLRPDAKVLIFEINPVFCEHLRASIQDERAEIIQVSAEYLQDELHRRGLEKVDGVVSGLPLINFPDDLRTRIWKQIQLVLKLKGTYVQFHFATTLQKYYHKMFHQVRRYWVPLNVLPAYVYVCGGAKLDTL